MNAFHIQSGVGVRNAVKNYDDYDKSIRPFAVMAYTKSGSFVFWDKYGKFPLSKTVGSVTLTHQLSDIQWGIGGFDLLLSNTAQDATGYNAAFNSNYLGYGIPANTFKRPRTAIGMKANGNIILAAIFYLPLTSNNGRQTSDDGTNHGVTLFQTKNIMKNVCLCTNALMIDGGGSTQVSYKHPTLNDFRSVVVTSGRDPHCRIRAL
jgi:hypothetical protein